MAGVEEVVEVALAVRLVEVDRAPPMGRRLEEVTAAAGINKRDRLFRPMAEVPEATAPHQADMA